MTKTPRTFTVSKDVVRRTEQALRRAGRDGYEAFVLWSGQLDETTFVVRTAHVPRQTGYKTREGLLVRVDADALHQLNVWLYQHDEVLGAQVHAHPTEAFHSTTDDRYPIVTTVGSLSIVAADFCRHGVMHRSSAAYRLLRKGWAQVDLHGVVEVV